MTKTELDTAITMVYGNLGHIKDVTNVTIDDFKDEIVCTVSGHTAHNSKKTPMLAQIPLTTEIFEKNGIKKVNYNYFGDHMLFESKDSRIQINDLTNSGDGYWNVHVDNEYFETIGSCDVKYVHQFQQLLRLCGYEMNVVV